MRCRALNLIFKFTLITSVLVFSLIKPRQVLGLSKFHNIKHSILFKRDEAIATSPSGGYAPSRQPCPERVLVRQPSVLGPLHAGEADYVLSKANRSLALWHDYLMNVNLLGFDVDEFLKDASVHGGFPAVNLPNLGVAMSGGGARAGLVAAGVLNAFDVNNKAAVEAKTGGILQLANYAAGLSGSSWLLGSWATSNFPSFTSLNQTVWKLTEPDAIYDIKILRQIQRDLKTATKKAIAGFPISIVDAWAQLIVDHTINKTHHANAVLFSSVKSLSNYKNHYAPFIIITATSREKGNEELTLDDPIYEFTPEEFGTWHPSLNAFIPIEFLGTKINQGYISRGDRCVVGFESMGLATSSNIFSSSSKNAKEPFLVSLIHKFISSFTKDVYDEAIIPNPFQGLGLGFGLNGGYKAKDDSNLYLADSSLSGETLPLWPLLQPSRKLDVIIAVDASNRGKLSVENHIYPNGTSLYASYQKILPPDYSAYSFPKIPDPYGGNFSRLGYNKRPVIFGCDQNISLIVYLPNHYVVAPSDAPTAQMQFSHTEIDGYFTNGFSLVTQNRKSKSAMSDDLQDMLDRVGPSTSIEWSVCLACALIDKQQTRNGKPRTTQCQSCFDMYCALPD
ncbi:lysophospholipase catalytic domain-domain-containing protein [Phakopsora pachyrhizi]|uniref:Lysophospholipase n=1 Tax=Phakopsora pachyrhizi TaxID=170000 RepID=A0AAV0AP40_PHAPC|nr:lysophospholipase catalytic domain-domain-containing protein [Phakopsora pachyrhizi]